MSLEVFQWIKDLVRTNPAGTDPKSQGDDHVRGLKATLLNTFPNFTLGKAITLNEDQLNALSTDYVKRSGDTMSGTLFGTLFRVESGTSFVSVSPGGIAAGVESGASVALPTLVRDGGGTVLSASYTVSHSDFSGSAAFGGALSSASAVYSSNGYIRAEKDQTGDWAASGLLSQSKFSSWPSIGFSQVDSGISAQVRFRPDFSRFLFLNASGAASVDIESRVCFLTEPSVLADAAVRYDQLSSTFSAPLWSDDIQLLGNVNNSNSDGARALTVYVLSVAPYSFDFYINGVSFGPASAQRSFVVPPGGTYRFGDQAEHTGYIRRVLI